MPNTESVWSVGNKFNHLTEWVIVWEYEIMQITRTLCVFVCCSLVWCGVVENTWPCIDPGPSSGLSDIETLHTLFLTNTQWVNHLSHIRDVCVREMKVFVSCIYTIWDWLTFTITPKLEKGLKLSCHFISFYLLTEKTKQYGLEIDEILFRFHSNSLFSVGCLACNPNNSSPTPHKTQKTQGIFRIVYGNRIGERWEILLISHFSFWHAQYPSVRKNRTFFSLQKKIINNFPEP